jgi:hypothetical protein
MTPSLARLHFRHSVRIPSLGACKHVLMASFGIKTPLCFQRANLDNGLALWQVEPVHRRIALAAEGKIV